MSDVAAAAAAMGVPEALVKRSAEARAKATGVSVDEILAAWAGGGAAPTGTAPTATVPAAEAEARPEIQEAGPEPAAAPEPQPVGAGPPGTAAPAQQEPRVAASVTFAPPVLVAERQGLGVVVAGSCGLLILSLLLAMVLPSRQQPGTGVRSSYHAFSSQAREGQAIYASQGCATCHTQLIRSLVTDVGLGPVSLDDTNVFIGYRRVGPDLAAIGARIEDTAALTAMLSGTEDHPAVSGLTQDEVAALITYLRESR